MRLGESTEVTSAPVRGEMSEEGFIDVMGGVLQTEQKGFNLNNNNCTDAAIKSVRGSGNQASRTNGTWEFAGISVGGGVNPGDLGEDIRKNSKANTKPGVAKTSDYDEKNKNNKSSSKY